MMRVTATVQVTFEIAVDVQSKRTLPFEQLAREARVAAHNVVTDKESMIAAMNHGHAKLVGKPHTITVVTVDDEWIKA